MSAKMTMSDFMISSIIEEGDRLAAENKSLRAQLAAASEPDAGNSLSNFDVWTCEPGAQEGDADRCVVCQGSGLNLNNHDLPCSTCDGDGEIARPPSVAFVRVDGGMNIVDLSPAMRESAIRDKLISMGWTPPSVAAREPAEGWLTLQECLAAIRERGQGEHDGAMDTIADAIEHHFAKAKPPAQVSDDGLARDAVKIRKNIDCTLDEVVGSGSFHLEQMSNASWFLLLGNVHLSITGKSAVRIQIVETRNDIDIQKSTVLGREGST